MLALFVAATVAATSPGPAALEQDCQEPIPVRSAVAEAPLRCRPAPYYISALEGRKIPRILLENRRGPPIELIDRQGRPCHLMQTPKDPHARLRVAD